MRNWFVNGQISAQPSIVGAHYRVIRGASQPAIINEWSFLIWLGFCQRSESVTSAPLSSFLGVSGGEGIATGKRTQMQTLIHEHTQSHSMCWFPTRSAQGYLAPSVVWIPMFWCSEITSRVSYISLSPHYMALSWDLINERPGQTSPDKNDLSRSKLFIRDSMLWVFHKCSYTESVPAPVAPLDPVNCACTELRRN